MKKKLIKWRRRLAYWILPRTDALKITRALRGMMPNDKIPVLYRARAWELLDHMEGKQLTLNMSAQVCASDALQSTGVREGIQKKGGVNLAPACAPPPAPPPQPNANNISLGLEPLP